MLLQNDTEDRDDGLEWQFCEDLRMNKWTMQRCSGCSWCHMSINRHGETDCEVFEQIPTCWQLTQQCWWYIYWCISLITAWWEQCAPHTTSIPCENSLDLFCGLKKVLNKALFQGDSHIWGHTNKPDIRRSLADYWHCKYVIKWTEEMIPVRLIFFIKLYKVAFATLTYSIWDSKCWNM